MIPFSLSFIPASKTNTALITYSLQVSPLGDIGPGALENALYYKAAYEQQSLQVRQSFSISTIRLPLFELFCTPSVSVGIPWTKVLWRVVAAFHASHHCYHALLPHARALLTVGPQGKLYYGLLDEDEEILPQLFESRTVVPKYNPAILGAADGAASDAKSAEASAQGSVPLAEVLSQPEMAAALAYLHPTAPPQRGGAKGGKGPARGAAKAGKDAKGGLLDEHYTLAPLNGAYGGGYVCTDSIQ